MYDDGGYGNLAERSERRLYETFETSSLNL
jgi:hypothetical protein